MPKLSLFQEPWWLSATTGGQHGEVIFTKGSQTLGRFSFIMARKFGFRALLMPAFTHVLGPVIDSGPGKSQTRLMRRLSITRALIDQLPPHDFFKHAIDPSLDDGLALADGLAFQDRGFQISPQYTFRIDCRVALDRLWEGMHFKVRQHIRRAREKYRITILNDPQNFISFYLDNLKKKVVRSVISFDRFPIVFSECSERSCGAIVAALLPDDTPIAMTYLVWAHGMMYYLLSTRAPDASDHGSVNLLIWSAMEKAHEYGLIFDLDGVSTRGNARFLSGFGGEINTRLIITRARPVYRAVRDVGRFFYPVSDDQSNFT